MKKTFIIVAIALVSAIAFGQSQLTSTSVPATDTHRQPTVEAPNSSFTIGPEDVIAIAVWKEPDFSATVPVRPDGKVSLALLGDVQAAGKTPTELAADLTASLKKYVAEPRVTVTVTAMNSRRVFMLGEITRPGPVVITPSMTVLQAVAAAGGPTAYANSKKMYVLRVENGKQVKLPFNYKEALKGRDRGQNIVLQPSDTIVVP